MKNVWLCALASHSSEPQQLPERYFAHPCGCVHVCLSCPLRPWDHVVNDIHINWRRTQKEENSRGIGVPHRRHHHYQSIYFGEKKILRRSLPRRANVIPRMAGSSLNNKSCRCRCSRSMPHAERMKMRRDRFSSDLCFPTNKYTIDSHSMSVRRRTIWYAKNNARLRKVNTPSGSKWNWHTFERFLLRMPMPGCATLGVIPEFVLFSSLRYR